MLFVTEYVDGQRVVDGRIPEFISNVAQFAAKDALPSTSYEVGT